MIGISGSGRSFRAMASYLAAGRSGQEHGRVAWTAARNLPTDDPELAGKIMRATAAANARVRLPVYHLALSFDPNDAVDRAAMERVADRVLERLALQDHQALFVAHRDREHAHVHLLVNRVHPETGKAWDRWQDQRAVQEVLRAEERALGLRAVPGKLAEVPTTMENQRSADAAPPPPATPTTETRARDDVSAPTRDAESRAVTTPSFPVPDPDRVTALARAQFTAARAADAARARSRQLDAAAARVEATGRDVAGALGAVYADVEAVRRAFVAHADRDGIAQAERMRERPETFGTLVAQPTPERRAFVLRRRASEPRAPTPEMVAAAATAGRAHIEAREALRATAAESRPRRLESAFDRALADLYAEPAAARAAFVRLAGERGVEHAANVLGEQSAALGAPRVVHAGDATVAPEQLAEWRRTAIAAGRGLMAARERAERGSPSRHHSDARLDAEPGFARREAELWAVREREARHALRSALAAPTTVAVESELTSGARDGAATRLSSVLAGGRSGGGSGPASTAERLLAFQVRRAAVDAMLDRGERE